MTNYVRMIAIGGTIGTVTAGALAAPSVIGAVADEPVQSVATAIEQLFPLELVDAGIFRKYDIVFGDSISTLVSRTQSVTKIGHGRMSTVTVVTTPSGTYSSDAILSPNVRYPGIETRLRRDDGPATGGPASGGSWLSFTDGSFTYLSYQVVATRT